jgi:hypothetical protein
MASTTTNAGLFLWDLGTDNYNHTQLQSNFSTIDSYLAGFNATSKFVQHLHTTATIPVTAALGDVVFLTAAAGGFPANTVIRYDGSAWRPVGSVEVQPSVPVSGLFAGRTVILSSAASGFAAWSIIRYDGTAWDVVGGWGAVNNGAAAGNIKGLQQAFDAYISDSARGFVLKDRTTGTNYRLFINNGNLQSEVVT